MSADTLLEKLARDLAEHVMRLKKSDCDHGMLVTELTDQLVAVCEFVSDAEEDMDVRF